MEATRFSKCAALTPRCGITANQRFQGQTYWLRRGGSQCFSRSSDLEQVSSIIKLIAASDITEFEMKQKGLVLEVRKEDAFTAPVVPVAPAVNAVPTPPVNAVAAPQPVAATPAPVAPVAPPPEPVPTNGAPDGLQITSPMAGTFYSAPAPGEPAFAKQGDKVIVGQTVCIIEAMKLMNEIEADVGGEVVAVLKNNGDAVAAGDPLLIIRAT